MSPIQILLADDHSGLRAEFRRIVEEDPGLAVIGEAADGEMAVRLARRLYPDIVLMDVQMPKMTGIEATRRIKMVCPEVAVIGLSSSSYAEAMVRAGASAYLLKQHAMEQLGPAIRRIAEAEIHGTGAVEQTSYSFLVIDDDPVFLEVLSEALHNEHPNITTETALTAEHGLCLCGRDRFDAIISDFRMSGLNGVDLLKECEAACPGTPVVLITGYGTTALEQDALDQGACAVLQKPVDPGRLYAVVIRAIRRSKWIRRTAPANVPLPDLQAQELAQQGEELSGRMRNVTQRIQDILQADNPS
jgi:DNA-binding NarL/FixJ family response regulator